MKKMEEERDLPNQQYEFEHQGGNIFSFETLHQIIYLVKFKPTVYLFGEDSIFAPHSFELIIEVAENLTGKNPPSDPKIPPTIAAIFTDFYENAADTITIYICDSSDDRQMTRQRKFDRWFEYFKGAFFVKIDTHFKESDGTQYPVSLIIKESNPFRTQIFDEFLNVVSGYNAGK